MNRILPILLGFLLAWCLGGCTSVNKWARYDPDPPPGPHGTHSEAGVVYHLTIEPNRDYLDPLLLLSSVNKAGPPYRIRLSATNRRGHVKTFRISKLTITMPDASVYDVLQGQAVDVPPDERNPWCVYYLSPELPLKFKEGARIAVEMHCETGGRNVEIRGTFVGRRGSKTTSIWEHYWSA